MLSNSPEMLSAKLSLWGNSTEELVVDSQNKF